MAGIYSDPSVPMRAKTIEINYVFPWLRLSMINDTMQLGSRRDRDPLNREKARRALDPVSNNRDSQNCKIQVRITVVNADGVSSYGR